MSLIRCPFCGHDSRDPEFCDVCQRELTPPSALHTPPPLTLQRSSGSIIDCGFLRAGWPASGHSQPFAAHWSEPRQARLYAFSPAEWQLAQRQVEQRAAMQLECLPPIEIIPYETGACVLAAWSQEAQEWTSLLDQVPIAQDSGQRLEQIWAACRDYGALMRQLHNAGLVWLNFSPAAIEVTAGGIRITNLDKLVFPHGQCPAQVRVSPGYSPPEVCRFQADQIGPATDVYHLALFAYYSIAGQLPHGFAGRGLESFHFEIPALRIFEPQLPLGIWPVLQRALAPDSRCRTQTIEALLTELQSVMVPMSTEKQVAKQDAVKQTLGRKFRRRPQRRSPQPRKSRRLIGKISLLRRASRPTPMPVPKPSLLVDVGRVTIAGAAKTSLGTVNQDTVAVEHLWVNGRRFTVLIVADGVSICQAGSGDLASQLAVTALLDSIRQQLTQGAESIDWPALLTAACHTAGQAVLSEAIQFADDPSLVSDNALMSTTVVAAVWDGRFLHVANAGDSRLYLCRQEQIELLTVDGDLGTSQLRQGHPPEQVLELGSLAKALRFCLGAAERTTEGSFRLHAFRNTPAYSCWLLQCHDVIVLCSDGLVEEGVFLEPEQVLSIVSDNAQATAQEMAEMLVAAADRLQRPATLREPSGFGDNIACITLRLQGE